MTGDMSHGRPSDADTCSQSPSTSVHRDVGGFSEGTTYGTGSPILSKTEAGASVGDITKPGSTWKVRMMVGSLPLLMVAQCADHVDLHIFAA